MPRSPGDKIEKLMGDMLDLPKDLVLELPRLIIIGYKELYLQNHKGIIDYSHELIRINLVRGYMEVQGVNLQIRTIIPDEITITGKISGVKFVE
ncbi:MAG: sporulation protein YqfC [Syntrophomonadaceae bacterium]|nr:sporulation protein YqfC [Syntrophomonadaceae bacterium]